MAVLCRKHDLLFIQNPRTASSAIGRFLVEHSAGEFIPKTNKNSWGFKKHASINQIRHSQQIDADILDNCLSFSAVRNPFDSVASLFQKLKNLSELSLAKQKQQWWWKRTKRRNLVKFVTNHTFDEFIESTITNDSCPDLIGRLQGVEIIMRFERISDDLQNVLAQAGINVGQQVPAKNITPKKKTYRAYYSKRSRSIMENVYRDVLDKFEYSF